MKIEITSTEALLAHQHDIISRPVSGARTCYNVSPRSESHENPHRYLPDSTHSNDRSNNKSPGALIHFKKGRNQFLYIGALISSTWSINACEVDIYDRKLYRQLDNVLFCQQIALTSYYIDFQRI